MRGARVPKADLSHMHLGAFLDMESKQKFEAELLILRLDFTVFMLYSTMFGPPKLNMHTYSISGSNTALSSIVATLRHVHFLWFEHHTNFPLYLTRTGT